MSTIGILTSTVNATTAVQLIGSLGFPIVACGALFWLINKNEQNRREDNAKFTEAINNNTIALTKMLEKIDNSLLE
jgi:CHASE3 domain sensor protein